MITPCISICKIDQQTRTCEGCGRSLDEIRDWSKYSDQERLDIMRRLGYGKRIGREEKIRRYDRG
jgi:predicted Fe-S protein YdhL (DUF1289 family)